MNLHVDGILPSDAEIRRERRRRGRRRILALVLLAVGLVLAAGAAWPRYRITVSLTDSLPDRVYLVHVGRWPQRGDLVAFRPPPNRFYPDGTGFVKIVRGVGGDRVTRDATTFRVDGVAVGVAKSHSLGGLPLEPGPVGTIPYGRYFVWTPDPDSFDSRYADIGWIGRDRLVGVAEPLFRRAR